MMAILQRYYTFMRFPIYEELDAKLNPPPSIDSETNSNSWFSPWIPYLSYSCYVSKLLNRLQIYGTAEVLIFACSGKNLSLPIETAMECEHGVRKIQWIIRIVPHVTRPFPLVGGIWAQDWMISPWPQKPYSPTHGEGNGRRFFLRDLVVFKRGKENCRGLNLVYERVKETTECGS